ncbi:BirA family transcriptional regulator, biotin operon repressor / biotin-[acetyl-CoA-carboxylase] ligase [Duganella sp. CF458]|uniref:biotin--[acetyl-CoA-carboxylase] ligase n=1 Tax=Duganella sp. CF458 TaxID=1884368 RepID=UPI0008EA715E|nr:biotin--[acetyl-CoA-carboxylase] ligase [Duganella sp. CF458]SFG85346.1 BirA family transcriptional regulator, biotin operon repressor / biotin-[acetyl-CoA-carboxylase] ligase [Duganella sp. CF458]
MNAMPLTAAAIRALVADSASHVAIEVVDETGSTNADLLARVPTAGQRAPVALCGPVLRAPVLRVAERQTAGRGRAGRSWLSAPGASLTFSVAWPFRAPLHRMVGLPLAVGVALAETVNGLGVPVQLKWPNDMLKDGAKLAGILVETQAAPDGTIWAVIGCGMNLLMPDEMEAAIGREVSSAPWLAQMDRNALLAQLLSRLCAVLAEFDDTGFAAFTERWNALQAWRGQPVRLLDQGAVQQEGLAAGVDQQGRLLLDTPSGRVAVLSGDVSLRLAP